MSDDGRRMIKWVTEMPTLVRRQGTYHLTLSVDLLGSAVGPDLPPSPLDHLRRKLQMFQLMSTALVIGDGNGTLSEETQELLQRSSRLSAVRSLPTLSFVCPFLSYSAADSLDIRPPDTGRSVKLCEVRARQRQEEEKAKARKSKK